MTATGRPRCLRPSWDETLRVCVFGIGRIHLHPNH